jgi:hypothetical protein
MPRGADTGMNSSRGGALVALWVISFIAAEGGI